MFRRVLVANRGEIALRVVRSLRELGIESVVIHGREDRMSLPVRLADEGFYIPREDPLLHIWTLRLSFLQQKKLVPMQYILGTAFCRKMLHLLSFYQKKELHSSVLRQSHLDFWGTKLLLEKPWQRQEYL